MNKRNKKKIIIVVIIILLACLGIFFMKNNKRKDISNINVNAIKKGIESAKYNAINGNIYYTYSENEETINVDEYEDLINVLSEYMNNNYSDIDILILQINKVESNGISMDKLIEDEKAAEYISGNHDAPKYDYLIDVYQIQDGIVLVNKEYRIIINPINQVTIEDIETNPFMQEKIDQTNFIGVNDAQKIVTEKIKLHLKDFDIESMDDVIVEERLEYNGVNPYYCYRILGAHVKIDALSGEIIEENLPNSDEMIL